MPLISGGNSVSASITWSAEKANTGFVSTKFQDSIQASLSLDTAAYTQVFSAQYTIAASGTQAVDFYSFTSGAGEAVTATKILGFLIYATGNSTLKVEPHGTNPLTWPFKGTAPYIEVKPSTGFGLYTHFDGTHTTLSTTVRQWLLTNTAANSLTVKIAAFVG